MSFPNKHYSCECKNTFWQPGKKRCSNKSNREELHNSVRHLGTQSCWYQLVQELVRKLPVLKQLFLLEKKLNFPSWEIAVLSNIKDHVLQKSPYMIISEHTLLCLLKASLVVGSEILDTIIFLIL